jgi:hypothetical protein
LITSHREGLLPTLIKCRTTSALLQAVVDELVDHHAAATQELEALFLRHDGNIREALRELYDSYAFSC